MKKASLKPSSPSPRSSFPSFFSLFLLVLDLSPKLSSVCVCVSRGKERENEKWSCKTSFSLFNLPFLSKAHSFSFSWCLPKWLGGVFWFYFIFFLVVFLQSPRHNKCTSPPSHYSLSLLSNLVSHLNLLKILALKTPSFSCLWPATFGFLEKPTKLLKEA